MMPIRKITVFVAMMLMASLLSLPIMSAANAPTGTISGKVLDENGEPVAGAAVLLKGSSMGTVTSIDGSFSINASEGDFIEVSCLGFLPSEFRVDKSRIYEVVLQEDAARLDDVVVVGYGTQKKQTLTGAVSAISSENIVSTKNENVQNMLTGKVAGLRVVQRSAEPGSYDTKFDIRGLGTPLIIIDGIPRDNMERLDPNDIESISVLKDASAAIYGVKAANGVVLVTTKSGSNTDGKMTLELSSNFTWQYASGMPRNVGAMDFMILSNEKGMNQVNGGEWRFPQEELDAYANGIKHSTDWYNSIMKNVAPQRQYNINVSGGTKKTQYFFGAGYSYQDSFLASGDLNYNKFNLRTSVTTNITDDLKVGLKVSGIKDTKNAPAESMRDIIYVLWRQYPTDPLYANYTEPYFYNPGQKDNPLPMSIADVTGYENTDKKIFQSQAFVEYSVPFVPGLSFKGTIGYDYSGTNVKQYEKSYNYYTYNEATGQYESTLKNTPSTIRRTYSDKVSKLYQVSAEYKNTFAQKHNLQLLALYEARRVDSDGFYAQRELSLDVAELFAGNEENQIGSMNPSVRTQYANESIIGRLNYNYNGKYLLEAAVRYDGSSRFSQKKRWGLFPSVSAGYRISEENFWKGNAVLSNINNFKIRASYGVMGDDSALDYQFLEGYSYPSGTGAFFSGTYINGVTSTGIPNYDITWYEARTFDIGVDIDAFKGKLGASFDYFSRNRSGLLATSESILPGTVGAELPQENLNSDRTFGYEFEIRHNNRVGEFRYGINANVSLTRTMVIYKQRAEYRSTYGNWKHNQINRYTNIWWGYGGGSNYSSWDSVAESPIYTSRSKHVGDYYYEDWNGDGFVDSQDEHPIGLDSTPLLNFGMSINMSYKGFDLNLLLQGAALSNVAYDDQLTEPFWGGLSAPLSFFTDRYRPVDPTADPFDQFTAWIPGKYAMMGSSNIEENSEANVHNGAYARLKNIELGYTLPNSMKIIKKIGIKDLRLYVNAYNILTLSGIKFLDPEHPSDSHGYMYPLNKTVSFGVNCKF